MERLRLFLADVLYRWACRLAGHDMIHPRLPDSPGAWGVLHAQRHERIAREWHEKYKQLRKRRPPEQGGRLVQF
jgi:hypothetical protein